MMNTSKAKHEFLIDINYCFIYKYLIPEKIYSVYVYKVAGIKNRHNIS